MISDPFTVFLVLAAIVYVAIQLEERVRVRRDLGTLAVASQANIGGAASAMALSSARGHSDALLPGVAVGIFGYAVGNYLGFAVAALMRGLLGR